MPRVAPITEKADVPAEHHAVVDDVLSVFGQIRGPFSMLLHSPPLAERMLQFVKFNRGGTVVEARLLSHAILASVRERDAHYVWAAQVGAARRAGTGVTIDILRAKGDPASLTRRARHHHLYPSAGGQKPGRPGGVRPLAETPRDTMAGRADGVCRLFRHAVRHGQRLRGGRPARRRQAAGVTRQVVIPGRPKAEPGIHIPVGCAHGFRVRRFAAHRNGKLLTSY